MVSIQGSVTDMAAMDRQAVNTIHRTNVGLMLVQRRGGWTNIEPTFVQFIVFTGVVMSAAELPCNTTIQYLLALQVSRYCILAFVEQAQMLDHL